MDGFWEYRVRNDHDPEDLVESQEPWLPEYSLVVDVRLIEDEGLDEFKGLEMFSELTVDSE